MYLAHKVKSGFTPVFQNDLCAKSFEQRFESSKGEFIMDKRISKDEYSLSIAAAVARRSTCLRRQYGAVIIKNDEIISTGYNGAARGEPAGAKPTTFPTVNNTKNALPYTPSKTQ